MTERIMEMLSLMPTIRRGDSSIDLFVDPTGIMIVDFRDSNQTFEWKLNGYPIRFVRASRGFRKDPILHRFEVTPSGDFYSGMLYELQPDLVELTFHHASRSFKMNLRVSELNNLVSIIDKYWTC